MTTATDKQAPTRWLDDEEMAAWLPLIRVVSLLPQALDRQLREEVGISHMYYQMMAVLSAQPDRTASMGDLARLTTTSPSRLSHAVTSLEQRGWLRRNPCAGDRRVQYATLTDEGFRVLEAVADEYGIDDIDLAIVCTPAGPQCPTAGATLRVTVRTAVTLPLVPPVLGLDRLAAVPVEATAAHRVSRFWGMP